MPDDFSPSPAVRRPAGRYGDRPPGRRRGTVVAVGALALVFLGWVVWAGLASAGKDVRWSDVGFVIVDDGAVEVTFEVVKDPGATARCTLKAMSENFATIGVASTDVGPAQGRAVRAVATVRTQERAVTGVVDTCELLAR